MFDRHAFGDLALAVLLVLPLAAIAHSDQIPGKGSAFTSAEAGPASGTGRIGVLS